MLRKAKPGSIYLLLCLWAASAVVAGAALCSYHLSFEPPSAALLMATDTPSGHAWRMVHVVSPECGCSQRVMKHLLSRGRMPGVSEELLLVEERGATLDAGLADKLAYAGFDLRHASADQLSARYHLMGVPVLVIADPGGAVVYQGGYGPGYEGDTALLAAALRGAKTPPYPVIGCAVSARIQRQVDPFHLKYPQAGGQ